MRRSPRPPETSPRATRFRLRRVRRAGEWRYRECRQPGAVGHAALGERVREVGLRGRTSFVLARLAVVVRQQCADELASAGLRQHQHAILSCLEEYGIDAGDAVAFVDGPQNAGLMTRERDERDRRRQVLTITAAGRRKLRRVEQLFDAAEPGALATLTAEQRAALHAAAVEVLTRHDPQA